MIGFFKQTGQMASDFAKKIAQQVREEPGELLRNTKTQVIGSEEKNPGSGPSVMQEVMTQGGKFVPTTASEERSIHVQTKSRLAEIEAELRQMRMQREQGSQAWAKEQSRIMGPSEAERKAKVDFVLPTPRKHHGPPKPGGKKSDSSMETSRQKKG